MRLTMDEYLELQLLKATWPLLLFATALIFNDKIIGLKVQFMRRKQREELRKKLERKAEKYAELIMRSYYLMDEKRPTK